MTLNILNKGFNYSQDGPGNRLVYHLQGCNFRCPWCSNPESIPVGGSMMIKSGTPKDSDCVYGAVKSGELDRSFCNMCEDKPCLKKYDCVIEKTGKAVSLENLMEEILSSEMMFFDGGGITLTGGEVCVQFEEVIELLKMCKEKNIHTAVESNASHPNFTSLAENVDFLIIDFKHYDNDLHKKVICASNENTLKNIRSIAKQGRQLLIRIPLVGGFNASEKDALKFAEFLKEINHENLSVEMLKYHEYGKDKWLQCGLEYKMKDAFVSDEEYNKFIHILENNQIRIVNT